MEIYYFLMQHDLPFGQKAHGFPQWVFVLLSEPTKQRQGSLHKVVLLMLGSSCPALLECFPFPAKQSISPIPYLMLFPDPFLFWSFSPVYQCPF